MTTETLDIGRRIRILRMQQNRTQQEIADVCEFSKSLLSKIERGSVVPPVATLVKIANALGTKVSSLVEDTDSAGTVYAANDEIEKNFIRTGIGYSIFPFATDHKEKKMQPFLFVGRRGEVKEHHVFHEGEEFIYVIEGEMKFQVGNIEYTLKEGDGLYFNALEKHGFKPVSETVKYLNIFV
jgi:transcriptional regulator with XRE-family HTH domain